jgi:hypothetical protein
MKIAKNIDGKILRNVAGKVLKFLPDDYVEPIPDAFQFEIEVDDGDTFIMPTLNSFTYYDPSYRSSGTLTYNYFIDWGDGSPIVNVTSYNSPDATHVYTTRGRYVIVVTSPTQEFPCFDLSSSSFSSVRALITRVFSWGNVGLKRLSFYGCSALTTLPEQKSKLYTLYTASNIFYGCSALTTIPYGTFFSQDEIADLSITDWAAAFYGCSKILSFHSTLFKNAGNATRFYRTFMYCTKLAYITAGIFDYCPNVTDFSYAFAYCSSLTTVPYLLFTNNLIVTSYSNLFYQCTGISTLPSKVFPVTTTGANFSDSFGYCSSLVEVPSGFFVGTTITNMTYGFRNCTNLTTIPSDLFLNQSSCTTFSNCFYYCRSLSNIPSGAFDIGANNVCTNMSRCFYYAGSNTGVTLTIPAGLFDQLDKVTTFSETFRSSNLEVIPTDLFKYCDLVTSFYFTFGYTDISAIPSGLFSYCTEVTDFRGVFHSCTSLTSAGIPSNLFANCTKVTLFGDNNLTYTYSYGAFQGCNNADFTYIPAGLFDSCNNVVSFQHVFYGCSNLVTIPTDLFRYNTVVSNFRYAFGGTAITATNGNLFAYNPSVTNMDYVFTNCTSLTFIHEDTFNTNNGNVNAIVNFNYAFSGCSNDNLNSIPVGLFQFSVNAKYFSRTFYNVKLTSIPVGLFANNLITETLDYCFYGTLISSIPETLFDYFTQVNTVSYCFYNCNNLTAIPLTLMNDIGTTRDVNFSYCFGISSSANNQITGAVPALWLKSGNHDGTGCFRNRLTVSNYDDIPATWK